MIVDDKSEHVVPFLLRLLDQHRNAPRAPGEPVRPFVVGLNGLQGAGKTSLVSALRRTLGAPPYSLPTAVISIDDFYLTHADQERLAASDSSNPLIQHRGQPSTHDLALARETLAALRDRRPNVPIPVYDKSAFNGAGDRAPKAQWEVVNEGEERVDFVLFEGWCVGFRALEDDDLKKKWIEAKNKAERDGEAYKGRLGRMRLEHVKFVNDKLKEYDELTNMLDAFVFIDAEDTQYVYDWRLQQETALRADKCTGMTDDQVINFVNGYYPAYELYSENLRQGALPGQQEVQLNLTVGKDRRVKNIDVR
ncbi:putative Uridine/cytidine kinase [Phyllosticta citriasiana]|uniref:putative Uridine/cytidine kinase n=1 Tax=Phyllosticta citriasiana TaxID=595635 RepID=UPI0030FDB8FD